MGYRRPYPSGLVISPALKIYLIARDSGIAICAIPRGLLLVGTGMSREDHRTQKPATHSRVSTDVIVVGPEARS